MLASVSGPAQEGLRIWEMPGTAHVDNYMFFIGGLDGGAVPLEKMAALWKPTDALFGAKMAKPINAAPQHHYVAMAALAALETWVRTGKPPAMAPRMDVEPPAKAGDAPKLAADAQGNTKGGIRTPWVDAPTARGIRPRTSTWTRSSSARRPSAGAARHDRARPGKTTCWKIRPKWRACLASTTLSRHRWWTPMIVSSA